MYRSVPGLENVKLVRPAYGVEYDHVDARELGREYLWLVRTTCCRLTSNSSDARDEAHQGVVFGRANQRLVPQNTSHKHT